MYTCKHVCMCACSQTEKLQVEYLVISKKHPEIKRGQMYRRGSLKWNGMGTLMHFVSIRKKFKHKYAYTVYVYSVSIRKKNKGF